MDIGQLFLNLGIKGTEKTVGALTNVKKGLSDTASISLEAKAAIVGAMYALERLFSASGKTGTGLSNFNALTGESVKTLQQYQYAARQVGVSNEEVESSFKGLQSAMTKTLMGQGAPAGLARVSQLTGGVTPQDIEKFSKNPELLLQKLQQYAQKEKNIGLRNETLKSFGISEGMIAGLAKNTFNAKNLNAAPTYSDKEVNNLNKANIAWSNLGNSIQMAVGKFNAKHGTDLVDGIAKVIPQVLKLVNALVSLAEKLKVFDAIGKAFATVSGVVEEGAAFAGALGGNKKDQNKIAKDVENLPGNAWKSANKGFDELKNFLSSKMTNPIGSKAEPLEKLPKQPIQPSIKQSIAPPLAKANMGNKNVQNNDVIINNNFQHPGTDHQQTGDSVKRAVQQGFRQLSAQSQAT